VVVPTLRNTGMNVIDCKDDCPMLSAAPPAAGALPPKKLPVRM